MTADSSLMARVDPERIEQELLGLWMAEAEAHKQAADDEQPLARVLLLTLVVCAHGRAAADEARELAVRLNASRPARTIILEIGPAQAEPALEAWATLRCAQPGAARRQVCGEQITFEAFGPAAHWLPGAVLPLLLPNVPAYLWYQHGSPFGVHLFEDLAPGIDRLIVDSCTFDDPARELVQAAEAVVDPHFAPALSDLSWARLMPWRQQTAQIFDDPALLPYLNQLDRVEVVCREGTPVMGWLYAAWLASRLGWRPSGRAAGAWHFAGGQSVVFQALPGEEGEPTGQFLSARLVAAARAEFEVARMPRVCAITRYSAGGVRLERVLALRDEALLTWLGQELGRRGRTPVYEAALSMLKQVLALPESS